jgi:poly-beta-1,6-N-acetyl-D-glucosamine N-deacetylase
MLNNPLVSKSIMKRSLFSCVLVLLLCIIVLPYRAEAYITILLYHRFDGISFPSTNTTSADFARQMEYLQANNYRVFSMDELAQCIEGRLPMPEQGVVITMDDGYLSEYTRAMPILKQHHYPFCIFVYTQAVGSKNYMNYDQLKQIRTCGGEVGCHTITHPCLLDLPEDKIEKEIVVSKQILEKNLGRPVRFFAYPFGQYDAKIRAIAKKAAFRLMLSSDPGSVGAHVEPDRVPRQAIVGSNMGIREFAQKLKNPPLDIAGRTPLCGSLDTKTISRIAVTLKDPRLYLPGHISMFLSEKGRLNAGYDPKTGVISCNEPIRLTRNMDRIIVTALRPDGLYAMDSYLIVLPRKINQQ